MNGRKTTIVLIFCREMKCVQPQAAVYYILIILECKRIAWRGDVAELLERGIPAQKLLVTIPAASVTYNLCYWERTGMSAEICYPDFEDYPSGPIPPVLYTMLKHASRNASEGWLDARDNSTGMMYTYNKDFLWAKYEDPVSVRAKADYIFEVDLGGAAILSLDLDDYIRYNGTKFPLTREIHNALRLDAEILHKK